MDFPHTNFSFFFPLSPQRKAAFFSSGKVTHLLPESVKNAAELAVLTQELLLAGKHAPGEQRASFVPPRSSV